MKLCLKLNPDQTPIINFRFMTVKNIDNVGKLYDHVFILFPHLFYNNVYHRNPICIPFFVDVNVFHSPRFYIFEEIRLSTKDLRTHRGPYPSSISIRVCVSIERKKWPRAGQGEFFFIRTGISKNARRG